MRFFGATRKVWCGLSSFQDSTPTFSSAPKFKILHLILFGSPLTRAIALRRIAIICFFIKVNQLVVVPTVDRAVALINLAVALIFDRLFCGSENLSSVLEECNFSPPR